jgi:hypothetical protein
VEEIHVTPTSWRTADVSAIVIRPGKQIRVVLQAELVGNEKDAAAAVKGALFWERKKQGTNGNPLKPLSLTGSRQVRRAPGTQCR